MGLNQLAHRLPLPQRSSPRKPLHTNRLPVVATGISRFDKLFEKEARRIGWPWQVLASIAYQESNFRPEVVGWSGARGLMGIMPRTGKIYGASVKQLLDPAVSVRVAVDCLKSIDALFQKQLTDPEERIKVTSQPTTLAQHTCRMLSDWQRSTATPLHAGRVVSRRLYD